MIIVIRYNMIGDLFYEATGKITNQRVLDTTGPKLEASFTAYGNMKDIPVMEIGTFWSIPRPNGKVYGEDKDIIFTRDNSGEIATANAKVIGQPVDTDTMRFVGSVFFNASSNGKLTFLNDIVGVFEAEVKKGSEMHIRKWEWK